MRTVTRVAVPAALAVVLIGASMPAAVAATHPSAPRSVTATPGNTLVRVGWVAPSSNGGAAVNQYAVQRAPHATGPWTTVAKPSGSSRTWTNTGLLNGTRYYFHVRAHNSAGWSGPSTAVSAVPRTKPSAPLSPAVTGGDQSATVSWQDPASTGGAALDKFQVQYSLDTTWTSITLPDATQHQTLVAGLSNGTELSFRVRAHNAAGWGPVSAEVRTTPGLPAVPTDFAAHSAVNGVYFSWQSDWYTGHPPAASYDVQLSSDGTSWSAYKSYNNGPTAGLLDDTYAGTYGQTFYVRARAVNAYGFSAWSAAASAVSGLAPGAVTNLAVAFWGPPFMWNVVTWKAPTTGTAVQGYYVDRIITEGPYQRIATVDAAGNTSFSYPDQAVTHTTDYWYQITPYNQVGSGPASQVHITTS